MSLAENMDLWMVAERDEARLEGRREGEEAGRREGEQLGLSRGRREAVLMALDLRFGNLGVKFWEDHLARQMLGPWAEILDAIKRARSLDDLYRFRRS